MTPLMSSVYKESSELLGQTVYLLKTVFVFYPVI